MSDQDNRPLSPHLSIYRWQISNTLSILHRLAGFALSVGTILLVGWLWSAAYSVECHQAINDFLSNPYGIALLIGWSAAFYYHLANGVRHLTWDIGYGFSLPAMTRSGLAVLVFTVIMTATTWWFIFNPDGAPW